MATFSGLPAEPTTFAAPISVAICPTAEPTDPAAPETNTLSPTWKRPMCNSPT